MTDAGRAAAAWLALTALVATTAPRTAANPSMSAIESAWTVFMELTSWSVEPTL